MHDLFIVSIAIFVELPRFLAKLDEDVDLSTLTPKYRFGFGRDYPT